MLRWLSLVPLLSLALTSCGPAATTGTPEVIDVYATSAVQPWLPDLYACAAQRSAVPRLVDSPSQAQVRLRIGQPEGLNSPSYQIDSEDILVVTNRESPVQNLSADEARALFSGAEGTAVDVWVFAPAEDVQQVFEQAVMEGLPITSLASLAASPQQMSDVVNSQKSAVGILPRHWKAGTVREVFSIPDVPVLAIVDRQPAGVIRDVLECLQK
jgi:hypothetical protein